MSEYQSVSTNSDEGHSISGDSNYFYDPAKTFYSQLCAADSQESDINNVVTDENYQHRECSPFSPSRHSSPHQYSMEYSIHNGQIYDDSPYFITNIGVNGVPFRGVRRRNTANKKERKRTQSLNTAYTSLRDRIPNVPADTKLSKIKTLRLAQNYITHLLRVLEGQQDSSNEFRAELVSSSTSSRKMNAERRAAMNRHQNMISSSDINHNIEMTKKIKGRTGWPQHVWANSIE